MSILSRDPCFGLCVASVACVGLIMEIALYCRSGATRKSGGAERSGERALQKNDGAERSAERGVAERERSGERRLQD